MKHYVPSRVRDLSDLERLADRSTAGAIMHSVEMQLEMNEPLDVAACRKVLYKCTGQIAIMLEQAFCLEQKLEGGHSALCAERRINLELQIENRKLKERNAELAKENRNIRRSLEEYMEGS